MKHTTLITATLFALAGASNALAADQMEHGRKDAMERDAMSKPAGHDQARKAYNMDKHDAMERHGAMDKMDKHHGMEKANAMGKMDKMEKPGGEM